jgi:flagellar biosynthesis chaperone FliJ
VKSKNELSKQAVNNNRALDRLAEEIEQKEATIEHLGAQRETLLDNYVKAQKLGLDLWVN